MALLHQAQLHPSKLELLSEWLPTREWCAGDAHAEFTNVAAYRFDDPAGEVGVETILVRAGNGPLLQVPLTYRAAPLVGGESSLIRTIEHSVLGKRWVYDGAGDPVYLQVTATAALNGAHQAELVVDANGSRTVREPNALVWGTGANEHSVELPSVQEIVQTSSGTMTDIVAGNLQLRVLRVVDEPQPEAGLGLRTANTELSTVTGSLKGTWAESSQERELVAVILADVRIR